MDSESIATLIAGFFMGGFFGVCLTVFWLKTKSGFSSLSLSFKPKNKKQNSVPFFQIASCRRCGSNDILKGLYRCEHCFFLGRLFDLTTDKPAKFPERGFE